MAYKLFIPFMYRWCPHIRDLILDVNIPACVLCWLEALFQINTFSHAYFECPKMVSKDKMLDFQLAERIMPTA